MKRKGIFITIGIILVIAAAGAAFYFSGAYNKLIKPRPAVNQPTSVTMEGTVVCLPHKDGDNPNTLECAIGLKSDGKYYGLSGATQSDLGASAGSERKVKVNGELQEQSSDTYAMTGVITVKDFDFIE